jgi:hypothetical protein
MTFLEKITFLTGKFLQLSQYVLKNAYRAVSLIDAKEKYDQKEEKSLVLAASEVKAISLITDMENKGSAELISFFNDKGLDEKDKASLKTLLLKRDYLVSYFYIDNANSLAKEDPGIYESKIAELNDYCSMATKLNKSLSKVCDDIYETM